jgi:outer membrane protein OmpA-like peptidoglycan-associated protein
MRATILATLLALGVGSSACATKNFVRSEIGELNTKVETLTTSVEDTQERTQQNEQRIGEVDGKADQVGLWARDAQATATSAASSASTANAKAEELDRDARRLVFEVVLSEEQGSFAFGAAKLPESAMSRLDQLIADLKADPRGAYVEIEGHTDDVGPNAVNERLGLARAESVKRYLYEHHQVPLHKINVISYGEQKPVASNDSREGRAQNRRVVIKVLA